MPPKVANAPTKMSVENHKKYKTLVNDFRYDIELQKKYKIPMSLYTNALSDMAWVVKSKNKENLKQYILENKNKKPKTTSSYLISLGNIFRTIDPIKYEKFYQQCFDDATLYHNKSKDENESETSEKDRENWIHFPYLELIRDKLADKRAGNRKDRRTNIQHLIMSLITYTPPVRLDYLTAEIYPHMLDPMDHNKPVKNWFDKISHPMNKKGLNLCYYVYQDKVGQFKIYMHGENKEKRKDMTDEEIEQSRFTIDLSTPDITCPLYGIDGKKTKEIRQITDFKKMNDIIKRSLEDFPRDFLLPSISVTDSNDSLPIFGHMTESQYKTHLHEITGKHLHQNLLRKIYIHYWYTQERVPFPTKKKIALYMRHSVGVAAEEYLKVNVPDDIGEFKMVKIIDPKKLIIEEKEHKPYFDPKEYGKKYRKGMINIGGDEKIDDDVKKKRDAIRKSNYQNNKEKRLATKQLFYLNKGLVLKPKQITIDKYGLEKKDDVWISTKF
jgi:hypothetical protein